MDSPKREFPKPQRLAGETRPVRTQVLSIADLLRLGRFVPARVQRDYQWGRPQCAALLTDFERSWQRAVDRAGDDVQPDPSSSGDTVRQNYFLGSFVVREVEPGEFEVFDGLQRLVTLTVLLAVLRDLISEAYPDHAARIDAFIFDPSNRARIALRGSDPTLASLIQRQSEAIRTRRNLSANTLRGRLLSAAGQFRGALKDRPCADIAEFADFALTHVLASLVQVDDERLARQIFITTNNRGLPLSEADVLRSQINSIPLRTDTAQTVLEEWQAIERTFSSHDDYQEFLYAVDFIVRRQGRGPEGLTELGEYLGHSFDDARMREWLVDVRAYSEAWHWLSGVRSDPRRQDPFSGEVFACFAFGWPDWKPLAMLFARQTLEALADRDRRRARGLSERFALLNRYCAAATLIDMSSNDRSQRFARAIGDVQAGRNPFARALRLSEKDVMQFQSVLSAPMLDLSAAAGVLRWIDVGNSSTMSEDITHAQIRLVLPSGRDVGPYWQDSFPVPETRWLMAHHLGNYVLVAGDLEDAHGYGFEDFQAVRKWLGRMDSFAINSEVRKARRWNEAAIKTRTQRLSDRIQKRLEPLLERGELQT